jgi:pyruvate,water dikinase
MGQAAGAQLARTLTSGLEGDSTYEQDLMLYEVAQGKAQLADFLERFGHRAAGEMELSEPRWREDPRYMEQTVARMRVGAGRAPAELHHGRAAQREAAEQELPQKLAEWGGSSFREEVLQDLREARALLPYRETSKDHLMRGYELIRAVIEELGRRLALGQDVYFLHLDELERFESEREELTKALAARKLRWRSAQTLHLPDVIDSAKVEQLGLPEPVKASAELRGDAVASGVATGVARVVFDPRQTGELGDAYILVCPSTDPGWTPLFVNARGLVVERGGVLSHGAIVARDFGLPAVVCPDATRLIRDGQAIRVDGNAGRIVLLDQEGVHA